MVGDGRRWREIARRSSELCRLARTDRLVVFGMRLCARWGTTRTQQPRAECRSAPAPLAECLSSPTFLTTSQPAVAHLWQVLGADFALPHTCSHYLP